MVELGRLKALTDGVVAVALTLLVFEIRVPAGTSSADLPRTLLDLGPQLVVYLIAFVVIGGAWASHQRMLAQIVRGDGPLVWFTLLFLLPVTLLPPCAALLGDHPDAAVAIATFAVDVVAIQLASAWLWRHASRHDLIDPSLDRRVVVGIGRRLIFSAMVFLASIPLALLNPWIAYAMWLGVFALIFSTDWLSWRQAIRSTADSFPGGGLQLARIRIRHAGGKLRIHAIDRDGMLADGVFGGGLDKRVGGTAEVAELDLSTPRQAGFLNSRYPWAWGVSYYPDWSLGLSQRVPIELAIESVGGLADLELGDLRLTELVLRSDGGEMQANLPSHAGQTSVRVQAKGAFVDVHVPEGVASAIRGDLRSAAVVVDAARFPPIADEGAAWRSAGYEATPDRVDIEVDAAGSSVRIV
jgi:TMEM175 potassium channel family protein